MLDSLLSQIEAGLPRVELPVAARARSVAVLCSSQGAQWQELMDWALEMRRQGFHLQLFTPEGRPVAFLRESLLVSARTAPLGFGAPAHLDPSGSAGEAAKELLATTASATRFNATEFGGVYLVGGYGVHEDVALALPDVRGSGAARSAVTANANVTAFMKQALAERLPIVAVGHAPILLAAMPFAIGGVAEPLVKGLETAAYAPVEGMRTSGAREVQFTHEVNAHQVLADAGAITSPLRDSVNLGRTVRAEKDGQEIITAPGPLAAEPLVAPTIDAMKRRWAR
jgi:putative intracellular protease/amidase